MLRQRLKILRILGCCWSIFWHFLKGPVYRCILGPFHFWASSPQKMAKKGPNMAWVQVRVQVTEKKQMESLFILAFFGPFFSVFGRPKDQFTDAIWARFWAVFGLLFAPKNAEKRPTKNPKNGQATDRNSICSSLLLGPLLGPIFDHFLIDFKWLKPWSETMV